MDPNCANERNYCYYNEHERPSCHFNLCVSEVGSWVYTLGKGEPGVDVGAPPLMLKEAIQ